MTAEQLELPLFAPFRSTADNPIPETDRTHPAQMVIQHCRKSRLHVSHARHDVAGWAGCPGTPDLRDAESIAAAEEIREQIRQMERRTYDCGLQRTSFHPPHPHPSEGVCPGLTAKQCGTMAVHGHHRWWVIPDAFYWCFGEVGPASTARPIEDVELP